MYRFYNYSDSNGIVELHVDGYLTEDLYFFLQREYSNILENGENKDFKFIFNLENLQLIKYQCVENLKKYFLNTVKDKNINFFIYLPLTVIAKYQIKRIVKELNIEYTEIKSYEEFKQIKVKINIP